jgi:hypothetical protein
MSTAQPGIPYLDLAQLPSICSTERVARILPTDGFFRAWLIQHFSQPTLIEDPDLQHLIWNVDPMKTRIAIESNAVWEPRLVEKRPGIIIKGQDWDEMCVGINNRWQGEVPLDGGTRYYSKFWTGAHTFFVLGGEDGEVKKLALEVARELGQFGVAVATSVNLFRWRVAKIGALGRLAEAMEHFVIPVNVEYAFEEAWGVTGVAPKFQNFFLNVAEDALGK